MKRTKKMNQLFLTVIFVAKQLGTLILSDSVAIQEVQQTCFWVQAEWWEVRVMG